MSELEEQACILFELTPSSPDYLWSISSDWLEDNNCIQIDLFKERKFEYISMTIKHTPNEENCYYWWVHGVKNGTGGSVAKQQICYGNEFTCNRFKMSWLDDF